MFCQRTWEDYQTFDGNRRGRICEYFGGLERRDVLLLGNWIPTRLINQLMDAHSHLRTTQSRGAYNATAIRAHWTVLAGQFRLLVQRAGAETALGSDPRERASTILAEIQSPSQQAEALSALSQQTDSQRVVAPAPVEVVTGANTPALQQGHRRIVRLP